MIDAGFTIAAAKLRSGIVLAHIFDPDLERRAGLAAIGRKAVPVIPNELTRTCHCGVLFVSASPGEPGSALQFELQFAHVRRRPPKSTQARDLRQRTSEDGQRIRAADS